MTKDVVKQKPKKSRDVGALPGWRAPAVPRARAGGRRQPERARRLEAGWLIAIVPKVRWE